jgi:hypothetical protein
VNLIALEMKLRICDTFPFVQSSDGYRADPRTPAATACRPAAAAHAAQREQRGDEWRATTTVLPASTLRGQQVVHEFGQVLRRLADEDLRLLIGCQLAAAARQQQPRQPGSN